MNHARDMKPLSSTSIHYPRTIKLSLSLLILFGVFIFIGLQACSKEEKPVNKEPLFKDLLTEQLGWNQLRIRGRIQKGEEKIVQSGLALSNKSNAHITECQTTIFNSDLPIDLTINRIHFPVSYARLYIITSTNIYYSPEYTVKEATSLPLAYKGGQIHVVSRNTEAQFRWALPPWKLEGANDSSDGRTNTQTLMINSGYFDAVRYCEDLTYDGYSDWYLPSAEELAVMTENKSRMEMINTKYWSSTEQAEDKAYLVNTTINTVVPAFKDTYAACRCIRRD